jgi:hypothetical protein
MQQTLECALSANRKPEHSVLNHSFGRIEELEEESKSYLVDMVLEGVDLTFIALETRKAVLGLQISVPVLTLLLEDAWGGI